MCWSQTCTQSGAYFERCEIIPTNSLHVKHPLRLVPAREDVPDVVEKERFSLGACRGGKLPKINGFTRGEPQLQERIGRGPRVPAVTAWT